MLIAKTLSLYYRARQQVSYNTVDNKRVANWETKGSARFGKEVPVLVTQGGYKFDIFFRSCKQIVHLVACC